MIPFGDPMDDDAPGLPPYAAPERVGDQLRTAREKAGLTLAEVAARTRVPLRHLQAIETNSFANLPSPTYASGFAKAYARAVDLDEVAIGRRLRGELDGMDRRQPEYRPVEASDPARVPSRAVTIVALGAAIAVLILAGLYFGTTLFTGGMGAGRPTVVANAPAPAPVATTPVPAAPAPTVATIPTDGQVVVTATQEVWVRLYDAAGKTLHQGTLQAGESFDVPAGTDGPMINVGRPDHLRFTVNGAAVAGIDFGRDPVKDVHIDAAALAARAAPPTTATPVAEATPGANAPAQERSAARRRTPPPRRQDRERRPTEGLSDTQRANLEAARTPPATGNTQ